MLLRSADESRRKEERSVDCHECIHGSDKVEPKQNRIKGRYCFKWSDEETREQLIQIEGSTARTKQGLIQCIKKARNFQEEHGEFPNFEKVMRGLKMCPWSWPFGLQEQKAMWHLNNLQGEMGRTLPYPNLPVEEQPNTYFQFLEAYERARQDYSKRKKDGKNP